MKTLLQNIAKTILFLTVICKLQFTNAQVPAIEWQKTFGGSSNELGGSIQQTTDGGYIVVGQSLSTDGDVVGNVGGYSYWVVKLNNAGVLQWQKTFGGSGEDFAQSVQQTTDGGFIIAGYSYSNDGDVTGNNGGFDFWVVKLTENGIIEWQKSLGGSSTDDARRIKQTTDGGYIVAGYTNSNDGDVTGNHGNYDYWVVKLNSEGSIQWQKALGGSGTEDANSICQTTDGGCIVVGYTTSNNGDVTGNHGSVDCWVVKLNSVGTIQWQKTLGGSGEDYASSIQQTTDEGYIMAGYTNSTNGDITGSHGLDDAWVVKLDTSGAILWQKTLGGARKDTGSDIQQTIDGGYIVAAVTSSTNGDVIGGTGYDDYWIVKLNESGSIQWQKPMGGTDRDYLNSIQTTRDKGYIVSGRTYSNNGDITENKGRADLWVVKLATDPLLATKSFDLSNFSIYPNPASDFVNILLQENLHLEKVNIYNALGQLVKTENQNLINVSKFSKGNYLFEVITNQGKVTKTIIIN